MAMKKEYRSVYKGEEVDEAVRRVYALEDYESDPTVPAWAKEEEPFEIGAAKTQTIWTRTFNPINQ